MFLSGAYSPLRLLHANGYVADKAFVFGIIAVSKWHGKERFPLGVFGRWPPVSPKAYLFPKPVVQVDDGLLLYAPAGCNAEASSSG